MNPIKRQRRLFEVSAAKIKLCFDFETHSVDQLSASHPLTATTTISDVEEIHTFGGIPHQTTSQI